MAISEVEFGIPLPDWLILRTHSVEITQMGQGDRQMRIADATRQNRESASHLRLRRISLSPYLLPKLHVITPYLGRTCVRPNPTSRARSPSGAGPSARTQNIPLRGGGKRPAGNMPTLQANDVVRRTTPKVVAPSGSTTSTGAPYQGTPQGEHHTRQVPRRTAAPRDQVPVHGGQIGRAHV